MARVLPQYQTKYYLVAVYCDCPAQVWPICHSHRLTVFSVDNDGSYTEEQLDEMVSTGVLPQPRPRYAKGPRPSLVQAENLNLVEGSDGQYTEAELQRLDEQGELPEGYRRECVHGCWAWNGICAVDLFCSCLAVHRPFAKLEGCVCVEDGEVVHVSTTPDYPKWRFRRSLAHYSASLESARRKKADHEERLEAVRAAIKAVSP